MVDSKVLCPHHSADFWIVLNIPGNFVFEKLLEGTGKLKTPIIPELRRCVKSEEAILGSLPLVECLVFVDIKQR